MLKRHLKSSLGQLLFRLGLHRPLLKDEGAIVLFHRVDDRFKGNPISCSESDFRRFCELFARYFEVISLTEMIDRIEGGRPIGGALAINLDDGYLVNYRVAAPILQEMGLPASFFITTDFIGSTSTSWWDAELGIQSEWMEWSQVRTLAKLGFEIGAHTRTHADLGIVCEEEARAEIEGSLARLSQELDRPITLFSYPFGGEGNINERSRKIHRDLGLRCCPSACGGVVRANSDPFHLRRQPVSPWHMSPWQLGFELILDSRRRDTVQHDPLVMELNIPVLPVPTVESRGEEPAS